MMSTRRKTALTASIGAAMALVWVATPSFAASAVQPGQGPGAVDVVVESSAAMAEDAGGGVSRMQAVQEGLRTAFGELPADSAVGLRVYGAEVKEGLRSCKDSSAIAPVKKVDEQALLEGVETMKPLGSTPMGYALGEAADDLPGDKPATIVLVASTSGSCGSDPCQVAADISGSGEDLHIDVVGFRADKESREQLTCIASASGGSYVDVTHSADLPITLSRLTARGAHGYPPAGRGVEGGEAAANAVAVSDGQWVDTIGDSGTEYYRLLDPKGGTLHVSAAIRPLRVASDEEVDLGLEVTSVEGIVCGPGVTGTRARDMPDSAPTTASYSLDAAALDECGAGPYTLAIASAGTEVRPLELLIASEPAVTMTEGLPEKANAKDASAEAISEAAARFAAIGSPGFAGAPIIEPGTYSDDLRPGESHFYRVDVDWGQQLICAVSRADQTAPDAARKPVPAKVSVQAYGSQRERLGAHDAVLAPDVSRRVQTATVPVRYLNRDSVAGDISAASRAGGYYCAVSIAPPKAGDKANEPVAINVTAQVAGIAGAGTPDYDDKPESAKKAVEVVDEGGISPYVWVGVPLVVIAGGLTALLVMRRRSARKDAAAD